MTVPGVIGVGEAETRPEVVPVGIDERAIVIDPSLARIIVFVAGSKFDRMLSLSQYGVEYS